MYHGTLSIGEAGCTHHLCIHASICQSPALSFLAMESLPYAIPIWHAKEAGRFSLISSVPVLSPFLPAAALLSFSAV